MYLIIRLTNESYYFDYIKKEPCFESKLGDIANTNKAKPL